MAAKGYLVLVCFANAYGLWLTPEMASGIYDSFCVITNLTYTNERRKSVRIWLFYLNQSFRFEIWECNCVKYLLGAIYHLNSPIQLESKLVGA